MILSQRNSVTGLPVVYESRKRGALYHALPRQFQDFTFKGLPGYGRQRWQHEWLTYEGEQIMACRCWKCGVEIKAWRMAIDRYGKPRQIGTGIGMVFTVLNNFRQTPVSLYWPSIRREAVFSALHCADCEVHDADAFDAMTCYLQGLDRQLQQAWEINRGQTMTRDDWATYLYLWRDAQPRGVKHGMSIHERLQALNQEIATLARDGPVRLPVPGEILTAAHYAVDVFSWQLTSVPVGAQMKYAPDPPPPGWVRCTGEATDPGRHGAALASLYPRLPDARDYIIKV